MLAGFLNRRPMLAFEADEQAVEEQDASLKRSPSTLVLLHRWVESVSERSVSFVSFWRRRRWFFRLLFRSAHWRHGHDFSFTDLRTDRPVPGCFAWLHHIPVIGQKHVLISVTHYNRGAGWIAVESVV